MSLQTLIYKKLRVMFFGSMAFVLLNLLSCGIFYLLASAWATIPVIMIAVFIIYFVYLLIGEHAGWFSLLAIVTIIFSYLTAEDIHLLTGKKIKRMSLEYFHVQEGVKTYSFKDAKILNKNRYSKWITSKTRDNRGNTTRHTEFYYLAPLVHKNWQKNEPVPAWVITRSAIGRRIWKRRSANTGVLKKRKDSWPVVIKEALDKFQFTEKHNAPLFEWHDSIEQMQQSTKNGVIFGILFIPLFWTFSYLIFYWPGRQ